MQWLPAAQVPLRNLKWVRIFIRSIPKMCKENIESGWIIMHQSEIRINFRSFFWDDFLSIVDVHCEVSIQILAPSLGPPWHGVTSPWPIDSTESSNLKPVRNWPQSIMAAGHWLDRPTESPCFYYEKKRLKHPFNHETSLNHSWIGAWNDSPNDPETPKKSSAAGFCWTFTASLLSGRKPRSSAGRLLFSVGLQAIGIIHFADWLSRLHQLRSEMIQAGLLGLLAKAADFLRCLTQFCVQISSWQA